MKEKDKKYQKPVKSFTEKEGEEGTGPAEEEQQRTTEHRLQEQTQLWNEGFQKENQRLRDEAKDSPETEVKRERGWSYDWKKSRVFVLSESRTE